MSSVYVQVCVSVCVCATILCSYYPLNHTELQRVVRPLVVSIGEAKQKETHFIHLGRSPPA